MPREAIDELF
jgi:hypothetical protein